MNGLACRRDAGVTKDDFGGNDTGGRSVVAVGLVFCLELEVVFVGGGEVVLGVGF